ncbi:MAG: ABC transporter permease [Chloroflexota bacterium]|nr:ABC transporter permease [Chloroflexota bacterium]
MRRFLARRVLTAFITLFLVSVLIFGLARMQGDPRMVYLSDQASKEQFEAWGRKLGLDRPLYYQYWVFLKDVVRGDLGESILQRKPVASLIWGRVPASAQLALAALLFSILIGVPIGVLSAVKRGTVWDYLSRAFALIGQAMPVFLIGLVLMLVFAVQLGWFPTSRRGGFSHYILPSITLGWYYASGQVRLLRSAMLDVLDSEYIKFARAKGLGERLVIWKHALRNAIIAPLTFAGVTLGGLVAGSIVVETVFAWPGIGLLFIQSVMESDYPVLQGVVLFATLAFVLAALAVDVIYAYVDPRIRYG